MPIYDLKCPDCRHIEEVFIKLIDFDKNLPACPICGAMMMRLIAPVNVMPDIQPYRSVVTGEVIGSRSTHKKHLKTHKLVELGNEIPQAKPKGYEYSARDRQALRNEIYQIMDGKS